MYYLVYSHQQIRGAIQEYDGRRQQVTPDMVAVRAIGVFEADTPETACKAAAMHTRSLGTFIAVECIPWGVDMLDIGSAKMLGEGQLRDCDTNELLDPYADELEDDA